MKCKKSRGVGLHMGRSNTCNKFLIGCSIICQTLLLAVLQNNITHFFQVDVAGVTPPPGLGAVGNLFLPAVPWHAPDAFLLYTNNWNIWHQKTGSIVKAAQDWHQWALYCIHGWGWQHCSLLICYSVILQHKHNSVFVPVKHHFVFSS